MIDIQFIDTLSNCKTTLSKLKISQFSKTQVRKIQLFCLILKINQYLKIFLPQIEKEIPLTVILI